MANLIPRQSHHLSDHSHGHDCKRNIYDPSKTQTRSKELYKGSSIRVTLHTVPIKLQTTKLKLQTTASMAAACSQHPSCTRVHNTWSKPKFPFQWSRYNNPNTCSKESSVMLPYVTERASCFRNNKEPQKPSVRWKHITGPFSCPLLFWQTGGILCSGASI